MSIFSVFLLTDEFRVSGSDDDFLSFIFKSAFGEGQTSATFNDATVDGEVVAFAGRAQVGQVEVHGNAVVLILIINEGDRSDDVDERGAGAAVKRPHRVEVGLLDFVLDDASAGFAL